MAARALTRISRRLLIGTAYAVLLAVVAFFALTRTEVGRSQLRQQVESQFNDRFAGTLSIGELEGSLLNTLYARDVRIRDDAGQLFLEVDTVVARPQWSALFSREVALRSLTLIGPRLTLRRSADSTWNATRMFRPRSTDSGTGPTFALADLRVQNGSITTLNEGPLPRLVREGWLFDYASSRVHDVDARLTVEWGAEERLIDIFRFTGDLANSPLTLTRLQGQLLNQGDQWSVTQAEVALDSTRLAFDATLDVPREDRLASAPFDADLQRSALHFDELRALVPRLPLSEEITARAQIQGPAAEMLVESLELAHGASRLQGRGTVFGLPDSLDVEFEWTESTLSADDLSAVWPAAPTDAWAHLGPVDVSWYVAGTLPLGGDIRRVPWEATSEFTVSTASSGTLQGTVEAAHPADSLIRYQARLTTDSLDAGTLAQMPPLQSRLNGSVVLSGRGLQRDQIAGQLDAQFGPSTLDGQPLDSLRLSMNARTGAFTGQMDLMPTNRGRFTLEGLLNFNRSTPAYQLTATAQNFDLTALPLGAVPATRLNMTVTADGHGLTPQTLAGVVRVQFDSSTVQHGTTARLIPPNQSTLALRPPTDEPGLLSIDGDLIQARLTGDVQLRPVWALGNLWGRAVTQAARTAWAKPYDGSPALAAALPAVFPPSSPPPSESVAQWRRIARTTLRDHGLLDGANLTLDVDFHRTDILNRLFPGLGAIHTDAQSTLTLQASADALALEGNLSADSLYAAAWRSDSLSATFQWDGTLDAPLSETLTGHLTLNTREAALGPLPLVEPTLQIDYANRRGELRFASEARDRSGPFRLHTSVDLLRDRNEITLHNALVVAGAYRWTNVRPATLYAYNNALVIPDAHFESPISGATPAQRIQVDGILSTNPRDTVHVATENVLLHPLSELLQMNRPVGGMLNGALALSGGLQRPAISSQLEVSWLSFGNRLLGHLDAATRYDEPSASITLDAGLAPETDALASRPAYLPATLQRAETNQLRVRGGIQLPASPRGTASLLAASTFDLDVSIDRADLFFFEYVFADKVENVSGFVAGRGQINGRFFDPLFQADLRIEEGQFDLPQFNLTYQIAGPVGVDRTGIQLNQVTLTDTGSGSAQLEGTVLFNEYEYFSFDVSARLDEMQIIDVERSQDLPFYGTIWASGLLTLNGPLSDATLAAPDARTTPNSELYIPITEEDVASETGFIIFADSTGQFPDLREVTQRDNVLADRPAGEPSFLDGLELDLNVNAPEGSTIHMVFDPLLGDVVTAQGSGRIQIQRQQGEFFTYGSLEVTGGEYLFTAGDVFYRRFVIDQGTITWDGNPTNAQLDLDASYRTRTSTAGLPGSVDQQSRIPVVVQLDITGRVESPRVDLSLSVDRQNQTTFVNETLDAVLNQPGLATEYATSVLLTNTFLLTTTPSATGATNASERLASAGNQLAFTSVSQLVASQLNRYLSAAVPVLDINLELQGEDPQNLDVIYGVALRLLDERLIIRGEGVYASNEEQRRRTEGIEGQFVVEVRLSRNVSVEAFYRRSGNELLNDQTLTSSTGAGISYRTEFSSWRNLLNRLLGWLIGTEDEPSNESETDEATPAARAPTNRER